MNAKSVLLSYGLFLLVVTGCTATSSDVEKSAKLLPKADTMLSPQADSSLPAETGPQGLPASNAEIMARKQVPILCYHQIRDFRPKDSDRAKDYIVPPAKFAEQMKRLADSGYKTILPEQLIAYLQYGRPLPEKPVMLHFDDADLSQFEVAKPVLDQYGFKACYFIMTVVMNKAGYMKREQIRQLSDEGHVVGSHTWDHMNVKKMEEKDWATQVEKPSRQLAEITGKPIEYFAYPFGLWNHEVAAKLGDHGFKAAFQLSEKRDTSLPLYTICRIIVPGQWNTERVFRFMVNSFK